MRKTVWLKLFVLSLCVGAALMSGWLWFYGPQAEWQTMTIESTLSQPVEYLEMSLDAGNLLEIEAMVDAVTEQSNVPAMPEVEVAKLAMAEKNASWLTPLNQEMDLNEYATQCAARMGAIPEFDCLNDGEIIPITVNGTPQSEPVDACDNPSQLVGCIPFARVGRLNKDNANVTTQFICRKYGASTENDAIFQDIAIIQHDRTTGDTCWFQTDPGTDRSGVKVPSPTDSIRAAGFWEEPSNIGNGGSIAACQNCHDADAFIWTPYLGQLDNIGQSPDGWNPKGAYISNLFDIFGSSQPQVFEPAGNSCTNCHRIGTSTCGNGPGTNFVHRSTTSTAASPNIWMPPTGSPNQEDIAQIERCCADPSRSECNTSTPDACNATFYVDVAHSGSQQGTQAQPFHSIAKAHDAACTGATVSVKSGTYLENLRLVKAITLQSREGTVTVGDPPFVSTPTPSPATATPIPSPATATPVPPTLSFSTTALNLTVENGGSNPTDQTLTIANSGTGTLNWTASESIPWLSLSATSGTAPSTISVSIDASDLAVGNYTGEIQVAAGNQTETVSVHLRVDPPGTESNNMFIYLPFISR